ncbi:MAG: hypothetical protein AB2705_18810 [Candidatus Thiodiazotropha sp.]
MMIESLKISLILYGLSERRARGALRFRGHKPGVLTGTNSVIFQNAFLVTAVAYDLYPVRVLDLANLAPFKDSNLNCKAKRVVGPFEGAPTCHGLIFAQRQKLHVREERVHESGVNFEDVADL